MEAYTFNLMVHAHAAQPVSQDRLHLGTLVACHTLCLLQCTPLAGQTNYLTLKMCPFYLVTNTTNAVLCYLRCKWQQSYCKLISVTTEM